MCREGLCVLSGALFCREVPRVVRGSVRREGLCRERFRVS